MVIATERRSFSVLDPADGSVVDSVVSGGPEDGIDAVTAAAGAAEDWASRAPRERAEILRRAFEKLIARREELAHLIVREMGKPLAEARGEVSDSAAPFGGAQQSGLGREGGHHGLLEFLEPKYFAFD
jgi:succinate-semialdehyde dehydrogenase / glutarate-semialdehyde dehydrogenase